MMQKAIVCGASGFVGSALCSCLLARGIELWGMGKRDSFTPPELLQAPDLQLSGAGAESGQWHYLSFDTAQIESLSSHEEFRSWCQSGSAPVFYYLVWRGQERLRDGSFAQQLQNVSATCRAITLSAKLGCSKVVIVGTQDEALFAHYLKSGQWQQRSYAPSAAALGYSACKLFAQEMGSLQGYLQHIDVVHTRFSVALSSDLSGVSYIARTLKAIAQGESYELPQNPQPYELLLLSDLVQMLYLAGEYGQNKGNYYLGYGAPATLRSYFADWAQYLNGSSALVDVTERGEISTALQALFSKQDLEQLSPAKEQEVFAHGWDYVRAQLKAGICKGEI